MLYYLYYILNYVFIIRNFITSMGNHGSLPMPNLPITVATLLNICLASMLKLSIYFNLCYSLYIYQVYPFAFFSFSSSSLLFWAFPFSAPLSIC